MAIDGQVAPHGCRAIAAYAAGRAAVTLMGQRGHVIYWSATSGGEEGEYWQEHIDIHIRWPLAAVEELLVG